jgi:hypothetical protein
MLSILFAFLLPTVAVDYTAHYGSAYQEALDWVQAHEKQLNAQAHYYNIPLNKLTAIVFPELLRYVEWQDLLETEALGVAYVKGGTAWADFSIGVFQMKPSFAETLEQQLSKWPMGAQAFGHLLPNATQAPTAQRQTRLSRLQTLTGQLDYLAAFNAWMRQRVGFGLVAHTPEREVLFLATAYNSGMERTWADLEQRSHCQFFPYGTRYPQEEQHAYSAVAWAYYQATKIPTWHWQPFKGLFWKWGKQQ